MSSLDEADRVIAAAEAAGKRIALNHEFREMPIFRALRDAAAPKDIVFAQVWQLMDLPPWAEPGWRGQMLQRTLYEAGVHLVDFLMALFGEKPRAVSGTVSTCGVREGETDAVALVTLEFSRGRLAQVVQNRLCKGETQYFEVRAETLDCVASRVVRWPRARDAPDSIAALDRTCASTTAFRAWRGARSGNNRTLLARNPKEPGMIATRFVFEKTLDGVSHGRRATGVGAGRARCAGGHRRLLPCGGDGPSR